MTKRNLALVTKAFTLCQVKSIRRETKCIKLQNNWTAMSYISFVVLFMHIVYADNMQRTESIHIHREYNVCNTTVPLEKYSDGEIAFHYNQSMLQDKWTICWILFEAPEYNMVQYGFHGQLPVTDCTQYTSFCVNACATSIAVEDDDAHADPLCFESQEYVEFNKTQNSLFISFKINTETPTYFILSFYILQQAQHQHHEPDHNDEIMCYKNKCIERLSENSNTYKVCGSDLDVCSGSDSVIINNTNSLIAVSISSGGFILILALALLSVLRHRFTDTTKQNINTIISYEESVSVGYADLENQSLDLPPLYSTLEVVDQSQNHLEHVLNKSLPTYDTVITNPEQYSVYVASVS